MKQLSAFGRRLTGGPGTRPLMDDLGGAVAADGGIVNLGGVDPGHVPAAKMVFPARLRALRSSHGAMGCDGRRCTCP